MSKKNNPIKELTAMLAENKTKRKPLLEGYLSEEDFDEPMISQGEEDYSMDSGEGDAMAMEKGILPIKNEIDSIRQIALKTIARLAEDPTSESYQMMKKIWMMCDKAIESALQTDDNNNTR